MSNTITDQLGIAEKIYAPGFLRFAYPLKAIPYCDQVVFQDGNISLVDPQGEPQVKIRKGDIIIRVYRNACSYQLIGTMATKDNYIRAYEIPIEITVSDPIRFAHSYFREEDPTKQAINALKQAFERYARKIEHNKIPEVELSFGNWSRAHLEQLGVHIEQKGKTRFREDPFHTEISLLDQSWRNQEAKLRGQQRI